MDDTPENRDAALKALVFSAGDVKSAAASLKPATAVDSSGEPTAGDTTPPAPPASSTGGSFYGAPLGMLGKAAESGAEAIGSGILHMYAPPGADAPHSPPPARSIKSAVAAPAPSTAPSTTAGTPDAATGGSGAAASVASHYEEATGTPAPWSIQVQAGHVNTPKDLNAAVDGLTTEEQRFEQAIGVDKNAPGGVEGQLDAREKAITDDWKRQKQALTDTFNAAKDRIGWSEALTLLSTGIARLGAGLYGMRTGVDVSGIKFDYYDWSKDYSRLIDEFNVKLNTAEKGAESELGQVARQRSDFRDVRDRLAAAQSERSRVEAQVGESNARMAQDANMAKTRMEFEYGELGRQIDANLKMANGRNVLDAAREDYKVQSADYMKRRDAYSGAIQTLQRVANGDISPSDPKEKPAIDKAYQDIGAFIDDPKKSAEVLQKSKSGLITRDKTEAQNFLNGLRDVPVKQPPSYRDYAPGSPWYRMATGAAAAAPAAPSNSGAAGTGVAAQKYPAGTRAKDKSGNPIVMGDDGQWRAAAH